MKSVPDATTLLKFRHLLEKQALTQVIVVQINGHLADRGMLMREVTIMDATIIAASPSTKNKSKARDLEMHQTKKDNDWYFGMMAHIGMDADSGLFHSLMGMGANVADITDTKRLLHGEANNVFADANYAGVAKRDKLKDTDVTWHGTEKRGNLKKMKEGPHKDLVTKFERAKAQIRPKVEHPFHAVKKLFLHRKVRYRGLLKNTAQLFTLVTVGGITLARRISSFQSA